jgi:hypothetical protein
MKQISLLDKDGYSWINLGYHAEYHQRYVPWILNLDKEDMKDIYWISLADVNMDIFREYVQGYVWI